MTDLRVDRLASLYVAGPLIRFFSRSVRIPILMYHSISEEEQIGIHPYYRTVTSTKVFSEHMSFLREQGYLAIGLNDITSCLPEGSTQVNHSHHIRRWLRRFLC